MVDVYHQDRRVEIYGITGCLMGVAVVSVLLRLWARKVSATSLWWDDYMILLALIFQSGHSIVYWVQTADGGGGRHSVQNGGPVGMSEQVIFFKTLFGVQITYTCTLTAFKLSLLSLYYRVFGIVRVFRNILAVTGCITIGYFVAVIFTFIFQCSPIAFMWDRTIPGGRCINERLAYLWIGIGNILVDFLILSLTPPMIWRLQTSVRRKLTLCGIFLIGAFVFVASIMRVVSFTKYQIDDSMYTGAPAVIWTHAEQSMGIVCACLPCLGPLLSRFFDHPRKNKIPGDSSNSEASASTRFGTEEKPYSPSTGDDFSRFGADKTAGLVKARENRVMSASVTLLGTYLDGDRSEKERRKRLRTQRFDLEYNGTDYSGSEIG